MRIILIFTIFALIQLNAQSNLNFEKWTKKVSYYDLDDWSTPNLFFTIGANISCTREKPYSGSFSLGISPIYLSGKDTIPGYVLQKFKYTQRAKSIRLYYLYKSKIFDSAVLLINFYKGYSLDTNNIIGRALLHLIPQKTWTFSSSDILWKNSQSPDSAIIVISNSYRNKRDTLFIDDLALSFFGTSNNPSGLINYNIFINSKDQLILDPLFRDKTYKIFIKNNIGQTVLSTDTSEGFIDLIDIRNGVYIYEIYNKDNRVTYGRFIKP